MKANSKPPILTPFHPLTGFTAAWSALAAMVRKELIILSRYPVQFFTSFAQVLLIVAIFSLAGSMFSAPGEADMTVNGVVVYGFVLFIFLSDTLWTIGFNVRREQVQGTLEQLYLSPASKFASLVSRVGHTLIWTGLVSIVGVAFMSFLLGGLPFQNPLLGLYVFVMGLAGTFGMGFAFAAVTLRLKESANTLANLLQFVFLIFCANFFPFSALPEPLLWVSKVLPPAYAVDLFRSTLMGFPPGFPELASVETGLVVLTVFGLVMPLVGYWLYRKAENYARRSGSLAQF